MNDSISDRIQRQEQRNKSRIEVLDTAALTEGQSKARAGWASSESGLPGHNSMIASHPRTNHAIGSREHVVQIARGGGLGRGTSHTCRVYQPLSCSHPKPYGPASHCRVPVTGLDERLAGRRASRPLAWHQR